MDRLRLLSLSVFVAIAALTFSNKVAIAGATLDRILAEKQIRLGVRVDAPPFARLVDGRPHGFTVELCGLIAGAIMATSNLNEMSGRFIEVDATDRFEKLLNGDIDVLCGATTATLTRREKVSFSIPTFTTGIAGLVSENASERLKDLVATGGPSSLSDAEVSDILEGKVVAARAGTTAES